MYLVPQSYIILLIFALYVIANHATILFNKKYREHVFKTSQYGYALYALTIIVMTIVLSFSAQCSIHGVQSMPSCRVFSWVLVALVLLFYLVEMFKIGMYVL